MNGDVECTGAVRVTCPADPMTGRRRSAARVRGYRCRPPDVRCQHVAQSYQGVRQRISSVLDRARRHGYCPPDLPTFDELYDTTVEELFSKTVKLSHHVLHTLLLPPPPSTASQNYNLRYRTHSLELPAHTTHLTDCAFITRMLYKDVY